MVEKHRLHGSGRAGRLTLVTDAWLPQTNGVVNTLTRLVRHLEGEGLAVRVLSPEAHKTVPLPMYPEVRVATDPWRAIHALVEFDPDYVHVATEGPLGVWARSWLARRSCRFTTSFHTRFPEYVSARLAIPLEWGYRFERWFHNQAERTLVGTETLISELRERRVGRSLVHWPRGVDTALFNPSRRRDEVFALPRPVWLYVGRVAIEKNLEDFLRLSLPGTKVIVGDGPSRVGLEARYPEAIWRGYRFGEDLAAHYASADCFVFPSRTETFGNVLLEAMASGLPVAACPSPGPTDLIRDGRGGVIADDLQAACLGALGSSRAVAREHAASFSWERSHEIFRSQLVPLHASDRQLPLREALGIGA